MLEQSKKIKKVSLDFVKTEIFSCTLSSSTLFITGNDSIVNVINISNEHMNPEGTFKFILNFLIK